MRRVLPQPQPHEEARSFRGEAGRRLTFAHRVFCPFKIDQIEATDDFYGQATKIRGIHVGADEQYLDYDPNGGTLSGNFKLERALTSAGALIDISFTVEFLKTTEWRVKLIGRAIKEPGDTREIMRERAVRNYERDIVSANPAAANDPRFREMIAHMLEVP